MKSIVEDFRPAAQAKNIQLTFISSADHIFLICDKQLVSRIAANLISNAIKYSRNTERPKIDIGTVHKNGTVTFFIKDNGVGFDQKYAGKLFKVFQRLHGANEFEGTGIGLAIVEKVISKHEGKIWVEAEKDKGAKFYFEIPS